MVEVVVRETLQGIGELLLVVARPHSAQEHVFGELRNRNLVQIFVVFLHVLVLKQCSLRSRLECDRD